MKIKDYLIAVGCAAVGSLIVIFFLWLFSLLSWAIVWVGLVICSLPYCYRLAQDYHDSYEHDFMVFLFEKIQKKLKDSDKSNIEL